MRVPRFPTTLLLMNLVLESVLSASGLLFWQVLPPIQINLSNAYYKHYNCNIEMKE